MSRPTQSLSRREFAVKSTLGLLALGSAATAGAATPAPVPAAPGRRGIWKIVRHPKALESAPAAPAGQQLRYGLDYPFQVGPHLGGLYCGTKPFPSPGQDFGGGTDIVLIEQPGAPDVRRTVTVSRNFVAPNPNNGGRPAVMMRNPGLLGFVPLGAKLADGRPHPHAGTGFALVTTRAWPTGPGEVPDFTYPDRIGYGAYTDGRAYRFFELSQLRYDGTAFTVGAPERLEMDRLVDGFQLSSAGMGSALADGEDLLVGMTAHRTGASATGGGVMRWQRQGGAWRPVQYELATPEDNSMEPSLVRDMDGSLLLFSRAPRAMGPPVRIWRQGAPGRPWELKINVNGMIPSVPVTLNRAVDGTPYLAANLYQPQFFLPAGLHSDGGISRLEPSGFRGERSTLCLWPLNETRDGFAAQLVVRDPLVEFGPPPHGTVWAADHATGGVLRLADGQWHALLGYRVLEWKENTHMIAPGPRTGSYLDEVVSFGDPVPLWNF
jgi:hypothetical protein